MYTTASVIDRAVDLAFFTKQDSALAVAETAAVLSTTTKNSVITTLGTTAAEPNI